MINPSSIVMKPQFSVHCQKFTVPIKRSSPSTSRFSTFSSVMCLPPGSIMLCAMNCAFSPRKIPNSTSRLSILLGRLPPQFTSVASTQTSCGRPNSMSQAMLSSRDTYPKPLAGRKNFSLPAYLAPGPPTKSLAKSSCSCTATMAPPGSDTFVARSVVSPRSVHFMSPNSTSMSCNSMGNLSVVWMAAVSTQTLPPGATPSSLGLM
mmetsp:Transcript_34520/g.46975  ORF Transcript_34520/g.46975 Transcript_34520/m.46975 type:complete len:206 (+) Transcript_34520:294-911(+)